MEIKVGSNWNSSSPLQVLLQTTTDQSEGSHGNDNVDPVTHHVVLTRPITTPTATPQSSNTCCITLDCTGIEVGGHSVRWVQLTSGARSAEYYVGGASDETEYIGTSRGEFLRLSDNGRESYGRLYCCEMSCTDQVSRSVIVKLPSLKGSDSVILTGIVVTVTEGNTNGGDVVNNRPIGIPPVEDMFGVLKGVNHAPPFVTSLLTALKTSAVSSDNLGDLTAMFRQIRKPDTPPEDDHTHLPDTPSMDNHTKTAVPTNHDVAMETRIKQYIDDKLSELRLHLDTQLNLMKEDILTEIRTANLN